MKIDPYTGKVTYFLPVHENYRKALESMTETKISPTSSYFTYGDQSLARALRQIVLSHQASHVGRRAVPVEVKVSPAWYVEVAPNTVVATPYPDKNLRPGIIVEMSPHPDSNDEELRLQTWELLEKIREHLEWELLHRTRRSRR